MVSDGSGFTARALSFGEFSSIRRRHGLSASAKFCLCQLCHGTCLGIDSSQPFVQMSAHEIVVIEMRIALADAINFIALSR